ncbi:DUF4340 domain-containing protein [Candidatus Falkowbacteria bacterium]|nr:DUF4340 domain-containing protein [Candidatus Falkowbacteria bacterium]
MKKNLILGIVLAVLIALAVIYQGPFQSWRQKSKAPKNFFSKVDVDKMDKIEIKGGKIVLEKQGGEWKVASDKKAYPASLSMINQVTSQLKAAQELNLDLVSASKDRKPSFQTDQTGTAVSFYQGKDKVLDITIGKMTSDYSGSYVSQPDNDNTYRTGNVNLWSVFASSEEWRDLVIFKADASKAKKIRMQFTDGQFTLEKKGDDWFSGKDKLNNDKVQKITDLLTGMVASEIPVQDFKPTGLDKNPLILQITGDGLDNTIMIGKDNGKGMVYAKRGDSDLIYLISKSDRDNLAKKPNTLK